MFPPLYKGIFYLLLFWLIYVEQSTPNSERYYFSEIKLFLKVQGSYSRIDFPSSCSLYKTVIIFS